MEQMGWIKFLADFQVLSDCLIKKLAFPAEHAYSRPSSMRTMAFLTFPPCCFITGFLVSNVRHTAANE